MAANAMVTVWEVKVRLTFEWYNYTAFLFLRFLVSKDCTIGFKMSCIGQLCEYCGFTNLYNDSFNRYIQLKLSEEDIDLHLYFFVSTLCFYIVSQALTITNTTKDSYRRVGKSQV